MIEEPITLVIKSPHCTGFGSWDDVSLLRNRNPHFFKSENALLVREQITDGSLQLPLLGAVKKEKKKKTLRTNNKSPKIRQPHTEVWNLGSPYFNICSEYKDLDLDLWERGNPGLSGDSETTVWSPEGLGTNYRFIPVISQSFLLRVNAGRVTTHTHPVYHQWRHGGSADKAEGKIEGPQHHGSFHASMVHPWQHKKTLSGDELWRQM